MFECQTQKLPSGLSLIQEILLSSVPLESGSVLHGAPGKKCTWKNGNILKDKRGMEKRVEVKDNYGMEKQVEVKDEITAESMNALLSYFSRPLPTRGRCTVEY